MNKWIIGTYIRLSSADQDLSRNENKTESDSISHQRSMIQDFICRDPVLKACEQYEFFDDGYSGTDFNRPAFEQLMARIRNGEINCVIVKDLSRFGRNYIELGDYLEKIFPFMGVRFISINDHYDSLDYKGATGGLEVAMKNIVYDFYSKDLSTKIKTAKQARMKRGEFIGGHPPFGLKRDPDDPHRLTMDPETAPVVRTVFDAAIGGAGTTEIARMLNEHGYETPGKYYQRMHPDKNRYRHASSMSCWDRHMILKILKQEMYYGAVVGQKYKNDRVGSKHFMLVPKEEQIVVEGMHQGIISKEEFQEAQKAIQSQRVKKADQDRTYPLWRKVRCGKCSRAMITKSKVVKSKLYRYFFCDHVYTQIGEEGCSRKNFREEKLNEIVWNSVRPLLDAVGNAREQVLQKKAEAGLPKAEMVKDLADLQREREKCDADRFSNVDQFMAGILDKDTYQTRRAKLSEKAERLEVQITELEKKIREDEIVTDDGVQDTLDEIWRFADLTELNQDVVGVMIDQVLVYDLEHVEIRWKFSDKVMKVLEG